MLKKIFYIAIIVFIFSGSLYAGESMNEYKTGVPGYMKIDFQNEYPDYQSDKLFNKVKYYDIPAKYLKFQPERIKFQSDDGIEILNITRLAGWNNAQTETWIAIDPMNPQRLIATANDNHYLSGVDGWRMSAFYSDDGGYSWGHSATPSNEGILFTTPTGGTIFDPGIVFDSKGNAFYCYGFTQTGKQNPDEEKNGVFIAKSEDGGKTWSDDWNDGLPISAVAFALESSGNPFHDRYSIAADQTEGSPYQDYLYVAWQRFRVDRGIVFSRSTNGGKNWSTATKLDDGLTQAPMPATGPDGEVYVAWRNQDGQIARAFVKRSDNGGADFGSTQLAQEVYMAGTFNSNYGRWTMTDKQDMRMSSPPQIAVDKSDGEFRGHVYIVQAGKDADGNYGVYLTKSTDKGNSWTSKKRIDNNTLNNDMFFPSISVDPVSGLIAVLYYSSQNDPENHGVDAYVAVSQDGGENWNQIRVSPFTAYLDNKIAVFTSGWGSDANRYWGDYTSITAYDSKIYPLYWLPTADNYAFGTNDLFTAQLSPKPQPVKNLVSDNIIEEEVSVKLNWENTEKSLFGTTLDDYTVLIYRDGDLIAELPKGTQEYIDSDVEDGVKYNYTVKIRDSQSRVSGATSINVIAGGSTIPMPPVILSHTPNANGFEITAMVPDTMIDGTEFRDFQKIDVFYETGELITSIDNVNPIQNNPVTFQVNVPPNEFYSVQFKTYGSRGGESKMTKSFIAYSGEPLTDLNESFDDLENMVPIYSLGEWSITDETAVSPEYSFTDFPNENYKDNSGSGNNRSLIAPIKITDKTTLSMNILALIEDQPSEFAEINAFIVEELYQNKNARNILKWVNKNMSENFNNDLTDSDWDELHLDLSQFVGETIFIEFAIQSGPFKGNAGVFIDDLSIDNSPVSVESQINNISLDINVYPNPANEQAKISVGFSDNGNANIEIYDLVGNKVMNVYDNFVSAGRIDFPVDLNNLSVGSYIVRVNLNGKYQTVPLIINR